jgi:hypothetical protein
LRDQWYELASKLNSISLNENKDEVRWRWAASKKFIVRSVYQQLTEDDSGQAFQDICVTPHVTKTLITLIRLLIKH